MRDIYKGIVLANPGNVFHCKVGGVHMGHPLSHQNEAPFPLSLAEGFVLSFCPPQGIVYDPFCGSGTTAHAAVENKRRVLTTDIRADQVSLAQRRTESVTPRLIVEADERMKAGAHDDEEEGEEVGETDCLFTS
jgi:DNA modification methylase